MRRLLLAAAAGCAGVLAVVPAAHAATVTSVGGIITFTALPGEQNRLDVERSAGVYRFNDFGAPGPPMTGGPGCAGAGPVTCPEGGVTQVRILAADGDDQVNVANSVLVPTEIQGGDGNDQLGGGGGVDLVLGGAGPDRLFGGPGADTMRGGVGDDFVIGAGPDVMTGDEGDDIFGLTGDGPDVSGGSGLDTVLLGLGGPVTPRQPFSIDDVANDGPPPSTSNVRTDVEAIDASSASLLSLGIPSTQPLALTGDNTANTLRGAAGDDVIDGRGGTDVLSGVDGNDTLQARDGTFDLVGCGGGVDTAVVDAVDEVQECETVDRAAAPPAEALPLVTEDKPPTAALGVAAGARLGADAPSLLRVEATDDRAVARVVLIDDGRIVGVDTSAPYDFAYRPAAGDVGPNTLVAIAVDSAEQTATDVRAIEVRKFRSSLRVALNRTRDRTAPFTFRISGEVRTPAGVPPTIACDEATVRLRVRRGSRTLRTLTARPNRSCAFSTRLRLASRRGLGSGRLTVVARYSGNAWVARSASVTRRIRTG